MFRCPMRESIERVVRIPDCSAAAFVKLLEYICLDDFTLKEEEDNKEIIMEELLGLAEMYLLEGLQIVCKSVMEGSSKEGRD